MPSSNSSPGIADRLIGLEQKIASTPDPETNARPVREAIVTVADRLGQLESRMSHREVDVANRPIVSALARLEDRFEHLAKRQYRRVARYEQDRSDIS